MSFRIVVVILADLTCMYRHIGGSNLYFFHINCRHICWSNVYIFQAYCRHIDGSQLYFFQAYWRHIGGSNVNFFQAYCRHIGGSNVYLLEVYFLHIGGYNLFFFHAYCRRIGGSNVYLYFIQVYFLHFDGSKLYFFQAYCRHIGGSNLYFFQAYCRHIGGSLVEIDSAPENHFIQSHLTPGNSDWLLYTAENLSPFYFSIFAVSHEGEFKTGLIELHIKHYVRNFENGRIQDLANSLGSLQGEKKTIWLLAILTSLPTLLVWVRLKLNWNIDFAWRFVLLEGIICHTLI